MKVRTNAYPQQDWTYYQAQLGIGDPQTSADFTPAGNAATKVPTTNTASRDLLVIANTSAIYALYVKQVEAGAAAPTISATSWHYYIPPLSTLNLLATSASDFYVQNSSGAATTSTCTVMEAGYASGGL